MKVLLGEFEAHFNKPGTVEVYVELESD